MGIGGAACTVWWLSLHRVATQPVLRIRRQLRAGEQLFGYVAAPDSNAAKVCWRWQNGSVYW